MKVNTDGVLLGAWAAVNQAKTILDIGTGTGVIALMMAQKNTTANIDAIEIDENAYYQAAENFTSSKWAIRLKAIHSSLQNYFPDNKYEVIICNPPYFADDLKTKNPAKNVAKHSIALSYAELLEGVNRLLAPGGSCYIVVPVFNVQRLADLAGIQNLFISRQATVTAVEGKLPYLALLQIRQVNEPVSSENITIQLAHGNFTQTYQALTAEFYLKF